MELNFDTNNGFLNIQRNGKAVKSHKTMLPFIHWNPYPKAQNLDYVREIEQLWDIKIPQYYIDFLTLAGADKPSITNHYGENIACRATTNRGGKYELIPMFECFYNFDYDLISTMTEFAYYYDDENDDIDHDETAKQLKLLPIYNANGSLVCLDFSKDPSNPSVSFADIEESDVYHVADSFYDFLMELEIC